MQSTSRRILRKLKYTASRGVETVTHESVAIARRLRGSPKALLGFMKKRGTLISRLVTAATVISLVLALWSLKEARETTRNLQQILELTGPKAQILVTGVYADFISPSPSCQLPLYITVNNVGDRGMTIDYIEVEMSRHETQRFGEDSIKEGKIVYEIGAIWFPEPKKRDIVEFPFEIGAGVTKRFLLHYDLGREFIFTIPGEARVDCDYRRAVCPPTGGEAGSLIVRVGVAGPFDIQPYTESLDDFCE